MTVNPRAGSTADATDEDAASWVRARVGPKGFHVDLHAGGHELVADEPVALGGGDHGPTPYDYLLAALGGCMVMTLRMYADRKGWPLEAAHVGLRSARAHGPDCENCEKEPVGIGRIERRIELTGPLTEEQRSRLLQIADRCPVKQSLERGIRIETVP